MTTFAIIQAVVLALVLLASLLAAFRKLLPQTAKRMQSRLSAALDRPARGAIVRRLGRWLQPAEAKSGGCGSGDGCNSCGGCAPVSPMSDAVPLKFRPRP
ncbi:DUF6587 family protein [Frateuria hangzhouensis]|uniref:DUF6587 family protein n=1 Tax=Frateuria hangzhouensis TaxID=2995589 RepID=UPI002260FE54|nr:DUF6587 family protein [Frateuria sp. STR12]MCX7513460.1 hypothetical protein [Frateuria sp. STR12]